MKFDSSEHPRALTLSLLIHAECLRRQGAPLPEVATELVIERYMGDWPEERRATLYAYLAESLHRADTHAKIRKECNAALYKTEWKVVAG